MNVLLITTDQHKASTLGIYGDPLGAMPNLDRLGAAGTVFTRCRTQNPFCQPARATILTGTYPTTHGVIRNGTDLPDDAMANSVATRFAAAPVGCDQTDLCPVPYYGVPLRASRGR